MTTVVRECVPISEARSQSAATTISSHPSRHSSIRAAIATAHANIALIKYWGKKDTLLRLPFTPSISMTVDQLYTTTRFEVLPSADHNIFVLGGEEQGGAAAQRACDYVHLLQQRFDVSGYFRIETVNHVPMSAGLASSSSAFAALAGAFAGAYGLHVSRAELSRMARLGSGSACRSIYGGLSEWLPGTDDHSSYAVALNEHPDIDLNLIAVQVDVSPKPISSTQGMARVVATSPYFPVWVQQTRKACEQMREAIQRKDFSAIGQIAQQNALDMHAMNLTARPGFTYFQPDTIRAMRVVDDLRASGVECYYTMDAGSNLKVLVQSDNVPAVMNRLSHNLPHAMLTRAGFGPGISVSRLGEKE